MTKLRNLILQMLQIYNHSIAKNTYHTIMKDSRWDQIQYKFALISNNGMSGIVASLIPHDYICLSGKKIDHPAFSFISPVNSCYRC